MTQEMRAAGLLLIVAGCSFQVHGLPVSPSGGDPSATPGVTNTATVPSTPTSTPPAPVVDLAAQPDLSKAPDLARAPDLASTHCSNMCCDDSCAAGETCQLACQQQGCSCDFTCHGGSTCGVSCNDQARCNVTIEKGETVNVACQDKASCDVQCADGATCNVSCPPDARCTCKGDGCNLTGCKPFKCKGGITVCGELCPP